MTSTGQARICKYCGFFYAGSRKTFAACPNCDADAPGWSAEVGNADSATLTMAIPYIVGALLRLEQKP